MNAPTDDKIIVRPMKIRDIFPLARLLLTLDEKASITYRPFPLKPHIVYAMLTMMAVHTCIYKIVRSIYPRSLFYAITATGNKTNQHAGLLYMASRKRQNQYIAQTGTVVSSRFRGMRVGTKMWDEMIKTAKQFNIVEFEDIVHKGNTPMLKIIMNLGFVIEGEDKIIIDNTTYPVLKLKYKVQ